MTPDKVAELKEPPAVVTANDFRAAAESPLKNPLDTQIGGKHYKELPIQPIEYIHANGLGFCEGNVVKYVSRWRQKGGKADLEKARHYLDLLIELEGKE